jgi:two-component system sensor histidine kinase MtrB
MLVAWVDSAKVERVVENLLANAGRHTTPDTPVWVTVTRRDDGVLLAVEDAGTGVPQELRAALFEPFRQGPEVAAHAPGVGIGLSLVARFAELHGGRAWVQDRPGGGASFQVLLPDPADPATVGGQRLG